jgi:transcriptional regulator GlxA family with amidase domain
LRVGVERAGIGRAQSFSKARPSSQADTRQASRDRLGIDDPAYFARHFRRETGTPPSLYRVQDRSARRRAER